jgi:hypothetical protein
LSRPRLRAACGLRRIWWDGDGDGEGEKSRRIIGCGTVAVINEAILIFGKA